ncbi:hypothetical protein B0H19DRAFT_1147081 [Mycena capillaripes]|nr:hypothetical protein B0H19DRAFT_1147081 [Mycena capillaripes]
MPPALRPSAPSTPRASTRTSTPTIATESADPPTTTPRKSPHCKTCGRPRKGHPLRACDADSPRKNMAIPAETHRLNTLSDALEAMNLEDRDRKEKRDRRRSAQARPADLQSLPSISTITGELLESLKAPGLLDDDEGDDAEKREAIIRWRETSGVPTDKDAEKIPSTQAFSILPRSDFIHVAPLFGTTINKLAEESTPTKKRQTGK